uniref:CCDC81 HU domain-containing protein n=1 Tax=Fundulus heteroclitus TaxID=8078 RepID=A0A3Q2QJW0_FUNHE
MAGNSINQSINQSIKNQSISLSDFLFFFQQGANLSGLGTFTLSLQNVNRRNRITTVHQPIFILAGKLAQFLGLSQVKRLVEGEQISHLPVLPLNFAAVSQRTPFSRGVVESCVRETLAELYRALASEKNVVLPFKPIGVLSFRNNKVTNLLSVSHVPTVTAAISQHVLFFCLSGKVQMKFSRDFVTTELCYLCMQRALRNVPEYQREQQEAVEKAQRNVLLCKQQLRDKQEMEAQLVCVCVSLYIQNTSMYLCFTTRVNNIFRFYLQKKHYSKGKCVLFKSKKSFLFLARPITPPKRMLQHCYMNDLQSQMERRQKRQAQDQQYRLLTERLDQIQLIQEIACQKAEQFQQKQEKTRHYKKALDTQARNQLKSIYIFFCDFPCKDCESHFPFKEYSCNYSQTCDLLCHSCLPDYRSAGQLLVDKLEECRRCCRCKRRMANCGETNIWKDSRYLSGSQFMV